MPELLEAVNETPPAPTQEAEPSVPFSAPEAAESVNVEPKSQFVENIVDFLKKFP